MECSVLRGSVSKISNGLQCLKSHVFFLFHLQESYQTMTINWSKLVLLHNSILGLLNAFLLCQAPRCLTTGTCLWNASPWILGIEWMIFVREINIVQWQHLVVCTAPITWSHVSALIVLFYSFILIVIAPDCCTLSSFLYCLKLLCISCDVFERAEESLLLCPKEGCVNSTA